MRRETVSFVPRLRLKTLDRHFLRRRQYHSFIEAVDEFDLSVTVDVGSGLQPWRGPVEALGGQYVAVDLSAYGCAPDVRWDGNNLPVRTSAATTVLLTEVLEHVIDPRSLLCEISRILAPGGRIYYSVPFLWPIHDAPFDEARLTPFALRRLMEASGFEAHSLWALGGWDASLAQMLGLWVRRKVMRRTVRLALSALLMLPIYFLDRLDVAAEADPWADGMFVGFAGTATRSPCLGSPDA